MLSRKETKDKERKEENAPELRRRLAKVTNELRRLRKQVKKEVLRNDRLERALRANESRFSQVMDSLPFTFLIYDTAGRCKFINTSGQNMLGLPAAEIRGCKDAEVWPEALGRACHPLLEQAVATRQGVAKECRIPGAEGERVIFADYIPLLGETPDLDEVVAILHDVTDWRQAEKSQKALMAELDHRVKNTLASIISIANQTGKKAIDFAGFKRSFEGRLVALAEIHNLLTLNRWKGVSLPDLVTSAIRIDGHDNRSRIAFQGDTLTLTSKASQSIYLALHELMNNAVAYGALSGPEGKIDIRWGVCENGDGQANLRFHWQETGGPEISPPEKEGFGTRLIKRTISYELRGESSFSYAKDGLTLELNIPIRTCIVG